MNCKISSTVFRFLRTLAFIATSAATVLAAAPPLPTRAPDASVDLATAAGVDIVKGQWRYSDTRIVETEFRSPDSNGQPTGAPLHTYDYEPHAGGASFDDSQWPMIAPTSLAERRSTGRLCFNWYRINITVPERVDSLETKGSTVLFETSLDDYAEVWI